MKELRVGIFVGGRGERLGGVAKGLLEAPEGGPIIERLCREIMAALPSTELVLVGDARPYVALGLPMVVDSPSGIGPLGGLCGLLAQESERTLVLPCDLPSIDRHVIARLAKEQPEVDVLVAAVDGVRNPLIARYRNRPALIAAQQVQERGKRSLQAVLDELDSGVAILPLSAREQALLRDWDTPEDLRRY